MEAFFRKNVAVSASGRPATLDNETILCANSKVGSYEGYQNEFMKFITGKKRGWIIMTEDYTLHHIV
jgi:hypothetical protein